LTELVNKRVGLLLAVYLLFLFFFFGIREQQEMQTENKIFVEKKLKICKICILTQTQTRTVETLTQQTMQK